MQDQDKIDWKKVWYFIMFAILFTLTVLYFAHVWDPPRWYIGTLFIVITLGQFVKMVEA